MIDSHAPIEATDAQASRCPIDHQSWSRQKTAQPQPAAASPIERDDQGIWHIHGFEEARAVLRGSHTRQAGFGAELFSKAHMTNSPVLYMEGKEHQQQRKQTARFFTPKAVATNYQELMEQQVDKIIARIKRKKRVDLSRCSLDLAVSVAAQIIGLTHSRIPGLGRRLDAFFTGSTTKLGGSLLQILKTIQSQTRLLAFFTLDVKPAIQAHKRSSSEDIISHLLTQNYSDTEILTECLTFGAAGMATTREFISAATWHFLEHPTLRQRYLAAGDEERTAILQEILRLEPVVGKLYRRTVEEVQIESGATKVTIPAGELLNINIHHVNTDESIVGSESLAICPDRELNAGNVTNAIMSFGDGHHRCPGSYVAIQETDIFLRRLLAIDGLHIVKPPTLTWNELITGYELRNFIIGIA